MIHSDVEAAQKQKAGVKPASEGIQEPLATPPAQEDENVDTEDKKPTLTFEDIVDDKGVPIKNRLSESERKMKQFSSKLDQLIDLVSQQQAPSNQTSEEESNSNYVDYDVKSYIDSRLAEKDQQKIKEARELAIDKAHKEFPELLKDNEEHDPEFLKKANSYLEGMKSNDPEAPYKAARLAALDVGKVEKLVKQDVMQDEARRSRVIAEGSSSPKANAKTEDKPKFNSNKLQRLLGVNPKNLEKRLKTHKDLYEGKDN